MLPIKRALALKADVSQARDDWELDRKDIQFIKELGRGSFGEVWYGTWKNKLPVAIKKMIPGAMSREEFLTEAAIMKKFDHPNVVTLYGVCTKKQGLYIVTEFMKHKSLIDFLHSDRGKTLILIDLRSVAYQVANGMEYIESKQLVHRDLAARNVLVGKGLTVKVADFGLARAIQDGEYRQCRSNSFPVKWTAPEGLTEGIFSIKSDVWSYGVLLTELFTFGEKPYPGMSANEAALQVLSGYRMPKPPHATDQIYRLMLKCWEVRPERRPSFAYLKSKIKI